MTALVTDQLGRTYDERVALSDVSLSIDAGQLVALIGHNGSGKSTLLRIMAGLLAPTSGSVLVAGHAPGSLDANAAVSYLGDTPVLYDDLTVADHLEFVARLHGVEDWAERARDVLHSLDMSDRADDLPRQLSRGLRQRAAAAIAFVRPFEVALIDEPFVGLDPPGRAAFVAMVEHAARVDGATVLLATHQLDMLRLVDRVVVLEEGAVVHDGTVADIPAGILADGLS